MDQTYLDEKIVPICLRIPYCSKIKKIQINRGLGLTAKHNLLKKKY
jgi:hypothetical protein